MITYVQGTIDEKQPMRVVLDVHGVGYELLIPLSSYDRLPKTGETVRLLVHEHIREDTHQLFGFVTAHERAAFELLLTISGVGPRLALSALSALSVRELKAAVLDGDTARLNGISGVGKKTAERMVLELRHKFDQADVLEAMGGLPDEGPGDSGSRDAVMALTALGYKDTDARKMVATATKGTSADELSVEEIIKRALGR